MIKLVDFSYRYQGSETAALQYVSLQAAAGDLITLTGPSGSGKSTLALALAGFLFNQYAGEYSGVVQVGDHHPDREPIYVTADVVGLVQQNPENQFCTLTVEDEIAFGLENRRISRQEIEDRLTWSLKAVGASHLRDRSLASLSGGEKQKIALAAILAARPRVIVFDEPTSNLDPRATREIFEVILDLQRDTELTVLVIEHKLDFLQRAQPRLVRLEGGRILPEWHPDNDPLQINAPVYQDNDSAPLVEIESLSVSYGGKRVLDG
ncbi:MAG: ABC transporter ATP-binding protein, partial [Anaerolineales bacterium]